jgi:3-oxo-5-alpha-steroid 4-dehydrogenase 1
MRELLIFRIIIIASFVSAFGSFISLFFFTAPYGRHIRGGWGISVPNWLGWLIMESPSPIVISIMFLLGDAPKTLILYIFLLLWEAHYIHRAFIYPFQIVDGKKKMPLAVMFMAVVFNLGNGYTNGRYLFHFANDNYENIWLTDPRFILGVMLFLIGYIINRWADRSLNNLRSPGETGYRIPQGGLYSWISCPNYFGEIVEWCGWATATWSLPGFTFAVWTIANLAPRARAHQRWYHQKFPEYPKERKILVPGVW